MTLPRVAAEEQSSENIHWAYLGHQYEQIVNLQSSGGQLISVH